MYQENFNSKESLVRKGITALCPKKRSGGAVTISKSQEKGRDKRGKIERYRVKRLEKRLNSLTDGFHFNQVKSLLTLYLSLSLKALLHPSIAPFWLGIEKAVWNELYYYLSDAERVRLPTWWWIFSLCGPSDWRPAALFSPSVQQTIALRAQGLESLVLCLSFLLFPLFFLLFAIIISSKLTAVM